MAEPLSGVNGAIIRWARERYNMSPDEAAQAIGVDISRYMNWENGTEHPEHSPRISIMIRSQPAIFSFPNLLLPMERLSAVWF